MDDLLISDLPTFVKGRIAAAADEAGHSIAEEARRRLVQSVVDEGTGARSPENAYDVLRGIFLAHDAILSDEEHAEFMQAVDGMRNDAGRPVPDFE